MALTIAKETASSARPQPGAVKERYLPPGTVDSLLA